MKILLDGNQLERLMRQAGFIDVNTRIIKIEIGDWGPGLQLKVKYILICRPTDYNILSEINQPQLDQQNGA